MARAVSTVLDVSVCLLLVGVAVTTLGVAAPENRTTIQGAEDRTTTSLGTVTASVSATDDRRVHDTLAGHLAAAAITSGSIEDERLGKSTYPDAVRRTVPKHVPERTHITVRWRPFPDAPLRGRLTVGPEPPSSAEVSATRMTIGSGMAPPESATSFEALARSFSVSYVTRLFPPERTRVALVDPRTAERTASRYRRFAAVLGVDIDDALARASPRKANERLAGAIADRLTDDLRETYPSPSAAANDATVGEVELVVRRWKP
jgi:hypothetical protein